MAKKNAINTAIIFTLCSLIFTLDIAIFIVSVAHYTFIQKHALWTIIYSSSDNYMVTFSILREKIEVEIQIDNLKLHLHAL